MMMVEFEVKDSTDDGRNNMLEASMTLDDGSTRQCWFGSRLMARYYALATSGGGTLLNNWLDFITVLDEY